MEKWTFNSEDRKRLENLEYLCPICHDLIQDPVETECSHLFCETCLATHVDKGGDKCPLCNVEINADEFSYPSFIKRKLQSIQVSCTYPECTFKGSWKEIQIHYPPHFYTPCPFCQEKVQNIERHVEQCPAISRECSKCNQTLLASEQKQHKAECLEEYVSCPFAPLGCPYLGFRKSFPEHWADTLKHHTRMIQEASLQLHKF